jgi:hypothetical protein
MVGWFFRPGISEKFPKVAGAGFQGQDFSGVGGRFVRKHADGA